MRKTWLALALSILAGCASLPQHVKKHPSEALQDPQDTALGRIVAESEAGEARNLSGVRLLLSGRGGPGQPDRARRPCRAHARHPVLHHSAGRVRARLAPARPRRRGPRRARARAGGRSQYRGRGPALHAPRAASERRGACVQSLPRRSVGHLEPHTHLDLGHSAHQPSYAQQAVRRGQRLAITGGRNIGDEYFTLDKHSNFIDLDVVGAGPIVPQLSASFDAFWNSKYAYPDRIARRRPSPTGQSRRPSRRRTACPWMLRFHRRRLARSRTPTG